MSSLSDRVYALAKKTGEDTQTIMVTYLKLEARIYARECEKDYKNSYEDEALNIMERYSRIKHGQD